MYSKQLPPPLDIRKITPYYCIPPTCVVFPYYPSPSFFWRTALHATLPRPTYPILDHQIGSLFFRTWGVAAGIG